MRTIAVINQKGGCGKTTTAVNLAATFASRRFRTLLIDMDPQSHCAAALGIPESQIEKDISDALLAPIDQPLDPDRLVWRISRGFDLVPSRTRLAGLEASRGGLSSLPDREHRLRHTLERLSRWGTEPEGERYDVCLIDCPPSIGLLTFNALLAASEIMIPVETSFFSLRGASKQMATIRSVSRRLGVRPKARILATMHDRSTPLANDLLEELRETFGSAVIPTVIRHDNTLKSAASFGRPAREIAPESPGAQDYTSVCEWLIEHSEIERATDEEMQQFEGIEDLGRRSPPTRVPHEPSRPRTVPGFEQNSGSNPPNKAGPDRSYTQTISRLEDLTRRARALHKTATEITPKPGPSDESLRSCFTPNARLLLPPSGTTSKAILNSTATQTRTAPPVAIEVIEDRKNPRVEVVDSVRRLFGARRTSRGALFVQPLCTGKRLAIAGSFNGWSSEMSPMRANASLGVFELQIELGPGHHEYKLVIDGVWTPDTHNPNTRPDDFGGINSLIELPNLVVV